MLLEFSIDNLSGHNVALGLSLSNRNEYQEYFREGGSGLTTLPPSCAIFLNLGASTYWNRQGLSRSVMGLLYLYLYLTRHVNSSTCVI